VQKRRVDRGGVYIQYFQMIATATILVKIFNITEWWVYVLGGIAILAVRYVAGYVDEKKKILANEQKGYTNENPAIQQILKDLEFLKSKYN